MPEASDNERSDTAAIAKTMTTSDNDDDDDAGISINATTLSQLKAYFDEAEESGKEGLEENEFVTLLGKVLRKNAASNRQELTHLFMKIDANSDGSVDWDEFTNFLLMENQSNTEMKFANPNEYVQSSDSVEHIDNNHMNHKDMVESVLYLPKPDKYLTTSRDGSFKTWSAKDLSYCRTVKPGGKAWLTSSCLLPRCNRVAVLSADQIVRFYDASNLELVSRFSDNPSTRNNSKSLSNMRRTIRKKSKIPRSKHLLSNLPLSVTTIPSLDKDIMAVGDTVGCVSIYALYDKWHACDGSLTKCLHDSPTLSGVTKHAIVNIHSDWITSMRYITELDALVTCSLDHTIKFCDIDKWLSNPIRKSFTGHTQGVYSFDYCPSYKFMVSCGLSRRLLVWDPFRCREITTLSGHNSSVQSVIVNDANKQIVSLSVDKIIKVWDVRNFKCIQTIPDEQHRRPENRIAVLSYNETHNCLLLGTNKLESMPVKRFISKERKSHNAPLCSALFNQNFHQIVSSDTSSMIKVWDFRTGAEVFWFSRAHGDAKITAMTFDDGKRRLISGADDGSIKVWNFSNGQCLCECSDTERPLTSEVTALGFIVDKRVSYTNKHIIGTGWDRNLRLWEDNGDLQIEPWATIPSDECFQTSHQSDILCLLPLNKNLVATGDERGLILIWSWDTKRIKHRLTPSIPILQAQTSKNYCSVESLRAVEALVWLANLKLLVSCGSDAIVRFWNTETWILEYEYSSRRQAKDTEALLALCCNGVCETSVFTGDAVGYVTVLDIKSFHHDKLERDVHETIVFRAHQEGIVSLDYVAQHEMMLSASTDHRVRLWTSDGILIGMFGQESGVWDVNNRQTWQTQHSKPVVFELECGNDNYATDELKDTSASKGHTSTDTMDLNFKSKDFDFTKYLDKIRASSTTNNVTLKQFHKVTHQTTNNAKTPSKNARKDRRLNLSRMAEVPHFDYLRSRGSREIAARRLVDSLRVRRKH